MWSRTTYCARGKWRGLSWTLPWLLLPAILVFLLIAPTGHAGTTRTQEISLVEGWNAVHLDVQPLDSRVTAVFDPAKVDFVARYFTPATGVRFIENPTEQPWNKPEWGVWHAPDRAEAFLTTLHAVDGGCAYLVHARSATTPSVTGEVRFRPLRWNADSFNLTGLPVEGAVRPTFARFFSGAAGKLGAKIYRLVEGSWQKIDNLATEQVRPGEAYWIYSEGKTTYQGPLGLQFIGTDSLTFGRGSNLSVIELSNRATNPFSVTATIESGGNLPLFRSVQDLANLVNKAEALGSGTNLGNLGADSVTQFRLEFRPGMMTGSSGAAVLKLSTSDGIVLRVPVRATLP